jgi:ABC-type uncharacterized transport system substrate-binding protein
MTTRNRRRAVVFAAGAAILFAATAPARVHPHVFAEATLEVTVDQQNRVESLGHVWRFDDLFSSTVLLEFDKNSDLVLDEAELEDVANVVHGSLADFDYFQFVSADGKDVRMLPPEKMTAAYENDQLMILFESKPAEPLPLAGKVAFGVYDPSFYTAIDFYEDDNMMVAGMPQDCTRAVVRPDPDEAIAANQGSLTEEFFNDPGGNDLGKLFATRLELSCKGAS